MPCPPCPAFHRPEGTYSASEVGDLAFAYVKAAKLDEGTPDPRVITLDVTLCDALFKGLIKKVCVVM